MTLDITLCYRNIPAQKGEPSPVAAVLSEAGHRVLAVEDGPVDLTANPVLWIQDNPNWFPDLCHQLMSQTGAARPFVVIWFTEPLPPPGAACLPWPRLHLREIAKILLRDARATDVYSNFFRLRQLHRQSLVDVLAVSSKGRQEFLAERGIAAHRAPMGYRASMYGCDMGLARDIDVCFLGALNIPRRKRLIKRLRQRGVDIQAVGNWFDPACWGERRTQLLNRTRILLNLQRYPGELSGMRLILGMANKALVISEPMYNPVPYAPGMHYVSATVDEMPDQIEYYLAHEEERQRIVEEGHRLVTEEVTLEHSVSAIVEQITLAGSFIMKG